ncbi:MAG: c-type cytochrome [Defluviimonas sp.]|uniref:c-type cytochrome n=1 Tax=Albidovulum sp. TaxID=1872424 RepID=UPI001D8E8FA8|nr:c-type cytochrome [Paracoccaceae bacterium]MCC0063673.1 c-type cytochrome [Defluviimonas sp.]
MKRLIAGAGVGAALAGALVACAPQSATTGRALYDQYCQSCHGTGGKGDGPGGVGLPHAPADLTQIAARNGGTFPMVKVMSVIDGYTRRGDRASVMPELGPALQEGPLVLIETEPGVMTPTPANLVALAEYLRGLQG